MEMMNLTAVRLILFSVKSGSSKPPKSVSEFNFEIVSDAE